MTELKTLKVSFIGDVGVASIDGLDNDQSYEIRLIASNSNGSSEPSNLCEVTPHPTPTPDVDKDPITSATGRTWSSGGWDYIYWHDAADFVVSVNKDVVVDIISVGGGGGGRGQLMPIGQGGDGGGGSVAVLLNQKIPVGLYAGVVGVGALGGGSTNGGDSNIADIALAKGGGTSQTKADGAPATTTTQVPDIFKECSAFNWNVPLSTNVSGTTPWDKTQQPNGVVYGQGGGGTNGTNGMAKAGNGQSGIVCVRYKKG